MTWRIFLILFIFYSYFFILDLPIHQCLQIFKPIRSVIASCGMLKSPIMRISRLLFLFMALRVGGRHGLGI